MPMFKMLNWDSQLSMEPARLGTPAAQRLVPDKSRRWRSLNEVLYRKVQPPRCFLGDKHARGDLVLTLRGALHRVLRGNPGIGHGLGHRDTGDLELRGRVQHLVHGV